MNLGIEGAEDHRRERKAGNRDVVAARHHRLEPRLGGYRGGGGDVSALAEILGGRLADEGVEIDAAPEWLRHGGGLLGKGNPEKGDVAPGLPLPWTRKGGQP